MICRLRADHNPQIVTFGTLAAKGVIRDVGRVMDLPYSFVDSIAKMIRADHNPCCVHRGVARQSLQPFTHINQHVHLFIALVELAGQDD